jgi:hypothetical protein
MGWEMTDGGAIEMERAVQLRFHVAVSMRYFKRLIAQAQ